MLMIKYIKQNNKKNNVLWDLLLYVFTKPHEAELKMLQYFLSDSTIKEKFSKQVWFPNDFFIS